MEKINYKKYIDLIKPPTREEIENSPFIVIDEISETSEIYPLLDK